MHGTNIFLMWSCRQRRITKQSVKFIQVEKDDDSWRIWIMNQIHFWYYDLVLHSRARQFQLKFRRQTIGITSFRNRSGSGNPGSFIFLSTSGKASSFLSQQVKCPVIQYINITLSALALIFPSRLSKSLQTCVMSCWITPSSELRLKKFPWTIFYMCENSLALAPFPTHQSQLETAAELSSPPRGCEFFRQIKDVFESSQARIDFGGPVVSAILAQLPAVDMQKVQKSFWCYSHLSPGVIQPSFDAHSLCRLHSDCAKTSTYTNRWSLDGSLAELCCLVNESRNYSLLPCLMWKYFFTTNLLDKKVKKKGGSLAATTFKQSIVTVVKSFVMGRWSTTLKVGGKNLLKSCNPQFLKNILSCLKTQFCDFIIHFAYYYSMLGSFEYFNSFYIPMKSCCINLRVEISQVSLISIIVLLKFRNICSHCTNKSTATFNCYSCTYYIMLCTYIMYIFSAQFTAIIVLILIMAQWVKLVKITRKIQYNTRITYMQAFGYSGVSLRLTIEPHMRRSAVKPEYSMKIGFLSHSMWNQIIVFSSTCCITCCCSCVGLVFENRKSLSLAEATIPNDFNGWLNLSARHMLTASYFKSHDEKRNFTEMNKSARQLSQMMEFLVRNSKGLCSAGPVDETSYVLESECMTDWAVRNMKPIHDFGAGTGKINLFPWNIQCTRQSSHVEKLSSSDRDKHSDPLKAEGNSCSLRGLGAGCVEFLTF
ncbi:hypothetical protein VP01_592g6 [Puccinia sorghi]|uniref:Uncharacterized protein n=1 Tax=Puccinia sorghi TaxID=27349 RepID=A0A0L6UJT5_9BASI|nr:hypothetical protein VP01_592g6 [Puccinia sorghi]